jgi:hypothetical protein
LLLEKIYPNSTSSARLYATFYETAKGSMVAIGQSYNTLSSATSNIGCNRWYIYRIQPSIKPLYVWNSDHWILLSKKEIKNITSNLGRDGFAAERRLSLEPKLMKSKVREKPDRLLTTRRL